MNKEKLNPQELERDLHRLVEEALGRLMSGADRAVPDRRAQIGHEKDQLQRAISQRLAESLNAT